MTEEKQQRSVSSFLKQNMAYEPATKEVAFKRFTEPFVIREITNKEIDGLRKKATRRRKNPATGQIEETQDQELFGELLVTASVVFPPLDDHELQESYGTLADPIGTLKEMLKVGEMTDLSGEVMKLSGINQENLKDLTDEVKK
ncbi:phage tail assembly chaperone [Lactiplantibacillus paraplantarum]|uniref:Phage portal protein n=1 Tax=Lactiplantibacillus paraplantarum TaxID=60520 RepID=A0AAD0TQM8_9LACO|nr:hypothetical protein [Lactiplantibacillus paraplantarum]AYJ38873.1 hypothetical protein LP667_08610 [Lactiplantibacillus paraplantarum]AYJ38927.1 hypothetical protein LP667_08905 [Lactiplantibacillus paraplantarum]KRL51359.1 hypothetical protein FD48_GL000039 [Lactiplantibacillus paraplantarum DSM 10667]MCU4683965.1 hypothetical protein [Lactiplantibacillus paraplantarum]MDL2061099.1 hypothetical protein [Lactiplantibacillus paraplantarum]